MQISIITSFWMELIATFIFIYVLLAINDPIPLGIVLIALMYFTKKFSNGAFNPIGSIAQYLNGQVETNGFLSLVVAQVIGGLGAYYFYNIMKNEIGEN